MRWFMRVYDKHSCRAQVGVHHGDVTVQTEGKACFNLAEAKRFRRYLSKAICEVEDAQALTSPEASK